VGHQLRRPAASTSFVDNDQWGEPHGGRRIGVRHFLSTDAGVFAKNSNVVQ
jgi:hypothetical protein